MAGKSSEQPAIDPSDEIAVLDITSEVCPMTFVRTRLALDRLPPDTLLRVRLRGAEPRRSVPENAASLGHSVVDLLDQPDGTTEVLLRRA